MHYGKKRKNTILLIVIILTPFFGNINAQVTSLSLASDQEICYNTAPEKLTYSVTIDGTSRADAGEYQKSTDQVTWTNVGSENWRSGEYQPDALTETTYYRLVADVTSNTVTITVYDEFKEGTISTSETICYNSAPSKFTATSPNGGDASYSYQWQKSTNNLTWSNISGATSLTYQSGSLTEETYFRRYDSDGSCSSDYTNTITITIYDEFEAGTISSSETICYNSTPSKFTATSPNGGDASYSYQWQKSTNNLTWSSISGATSLTYQSNSLTETTYFRRYDSDGNCSSDYTNTVTVTVYEEFEGGTISSSETICYNSIPSKFTATFPNKGDGSYSYQWQKSTNNLTWSSISGATSLTYQSDALTETTYFRRYDSDSSCSSDYTNTVTVTVYNEFEEGILYLSETISYNTAPSKLTGTSANGGDGSYSYQWQSSTNDSIWTNEALATSSSYQSDALTETTYFRRNDSDGNCSSDYTNTVTITLYDEFEGGTISSSETISYNSAPSKFTGTSASGGNGSYSYQWYYSTNGNSWSSIIGATSLNYQSGALIETTYFKRYNSDNGDNSDYTNTIIITVSESLEITTSQDDETICYDTAPSIFNEISISGGFGSYTYQWLSSTDMINWLNIEGEISLNYQSGSLIKTTYFKLAVNDDSETYYSDIIKIEVYDKFCAGIIGTNQSITYDSEPDQLTTSVNANGGSGSYTYQWQSSTDGSTWTNIEGETSSSYQSSSLTETTYFRRYDSDNICNSDFTNIITISVINGDDIIGEIGDDHSICYNSIPDELTTITQDDSYTYQWQISTDGEKWSNIIGETSSSYQSGSLTETTYFRKEVATSSNGYLYSNIVTITVYDEFDTEDIYPESNYCNGEEVTIESLSKLTTWYSSDMVELNTSNELSFTAEESTTYYYQEANSIGCLGSLKELNITVDFVEINIEKDPANSSSIENGVMLTIDANAESNFSSSEIEYTWTFNNQNEGWYETMFDKTPSQYFHWKGWYNITLVTETPTGCETTFNIESVFYVDEETEDNRTKSEFTGTKQSIKLDASFGTNESTKVYIYPTIFNTEITVDIDNIESKANFYIYDITGSLFIHQDLEEEANLISTSMLSKGIYIIEITSKDGDSLFKTKVIKQ